MKNTWNWFVAGTWYQSQLSKNVYTTDTAGNRLTNAITDNTGTARTETYGYDELNRLTSVNYGDGQTQTYSFDPMGNRSQKVDSVSGTENYTYNNANMLLTRGANNYTNDPDGNTLTGGGRTSAWDSQNRLATCSFGGNSCSYVYGADGLRHRGTVNGTVTHCVLDQDGLVREVRGGASVATYLTGAIGPVYRRDDGAGSVRWYLFDGLGSALGELDPNGSVTCFRKYDVYGSVRSTTGTGTSKQRFVGQLGHATDDESNLVYMRARYYDPTTGRFISQDPSCHGRNWFVYVRNRPTCLRDYTGRMADLLAATADMDIEMAEALSLITMGMKAVAGAVLVILVACIAIELADDTIAFARKKQDIRFVDWVQDKYQLSNTEREWLHEIIQDQGLSGDRAAIDDAAKDIADARRPPDAPPSGGDTGDQGDE